MTKEEFYNLKIGDVIEHKRTNHKYMINRKINDCVYEIADMMYLGMKNYLNDRIIDDYKVKEND